MTQFDRSMCALRSVLLTIMIVASPGWSQAAECEAAHDPAQQSNQGTRIAFHNDTSYAMRLYWIDFDGFLTEYGLLQPQESAGFDTYVGHRWLLEAYTPDGAECLGPISASDQSGCDMHILYDGGFGYNPSMCDF